jgi:hypothetical protein
VVAGDRGRNVLLYAFGSYDTLTDNRLAGWRSGCAVYRDERPSWSVSEAALDSFQEDVDLDVTGWDLHADGSVLCSSRVCFSIRCVISESSHSRKMVAQRCTVARDGGITCSNCGSGVRIYGTNSSSSVLRSKPNCWAAF